MEEVQAMLGILLVSAIALTGYFVISGGGAGAVISQNYVACCCNILVTDGQQVLVRNQIQTFAADCQTACSYYQDATVGDKGRVFPQTGLCAANP